jgi:hypothetical protein
MRALWKTFERSADLLANARFVAQNLALVARRVAALEALGREATEAPTTSCLCTQARCDGPAFRAWCDELHERARHHRKLWEFVFIARALDERGMLAPGRRGLGFGVGTEPLPAAFAARGATIVGTDQPPSSAVASSWATSAEHAAGLEGLNGRGICPPREFAERVSYRAVDMNHVPGDLAGFDFCWSACALEHLGDLEAGMAFVERSLACLRPGGVAVHTTELNLSSNESTVARGWTVLYRRRDVEALVRRLEAAGHEVAPVDWDPGQGVLDEYVDVPPYDPDTHLRLALKGFVTTSFGLIVRRGAPSAPVVEGHLKR